MGNDLEARFLAFIVCALPAGTNGTGTTGVGFYHKDSTIKKNTTHLLETNL